jgi:hypothetical protein
MHGVAQRIGERGDTVSVSRRKVGRFAPLVVKM